MVSLRGDGSGVQRDRTVHGERSQRRDAAHRPAKGHRAIDRERERAVHVRPPRHGRSLQHRVAAERRRSGVGLSSGRGNHSAAEDGRAGDAQRGERAAGTHRAIENRIALDHESKRSVERSVKRDRGPGEGRIATERERAGVSLPARRDDGGRVRLARSRNGQRCQRRGASHRSAEHRVASERERVGSVQSRTKRQKRARQRAVGAQGRGAGVGLAVRRPHAGAVQCARAADVQRRQGRGGSDRAGKRGIARDGQRVRAVERAVEDNARAARERGVERQRRRAAIGLISRRRDRGGVKRRRSGDRQRPQRRAAAHRTVERGGARRRQRERPVERAAKLDRRTAQTRGRSQRRRTVVTLRAGGRNVSAVQRARPGHGQGGERHGLADRSVERRVAVERERERSVQRTADRHQRPFQRRVAPQRNRTEVRLRRARRDPWRRQRRRARHRQRQQRSDIADQAAKRRIARHRQRETAVHRPVDGDERTRQRGVAGEGHLARVGLRPHGRHGAALQSRPPRNTEQTQRGALADRSAKRRVARDRERPGGVDGRVDRNLAARQVEIVRKRRLAAVALLARRPDRSSVQHCRARNRQRGERGRRADRIGESCPAGDGQRTRSIDRAAKRRPARSRREFRRSRDVHRPGIDLVAHRRDPRGRQRRRPRRDRQTRQGCVRTDRAGQMHHRRNQRERVDAIDRAAQRDLRRSRVQHRERGIGAQRQRPVVGLRTTGAHRRAVQPRVAVHRQARQRRRRTHGIREGNTPARGQRQRVRPVHPSETERARARVDRERAVQGRGREDSDRAARGRRGHDRSAGIADDQRIRGCVAEGDRSAAEELRAVKGHTAVEQTVESSAADRHVVGKRHRTVGGLHDARRGADGAGKGRRPGGIDRDRRPAPAAEPRHRTDRRRPRHIEREIVCPLHRRHRQAARRQGDIASDRHRTRIVLTQRRPDQAAVERGGADIQKVQRHRGAHGAVERDRHRIVERAQFARPFDRAIERRARAIEIRVPEQRHFPAKQLRAGDEYRAEAGERLGRDDRLPRHVQG